MMRRLVSDLAFVAAILLLVVLSAQAQLSSFPPGTFQGRSDPVAVVVPFQGVGDVAGIGTAFGAYSCTRAYTAAYATALSAACDVVDSATGLVTCTYHFQATGFVLPSECNGVGQSCATACKVPQVYDQSGNSRPVVQATLANMPVLTFNSINGLPAINCGTNIATIVMSTSGSFTQALPITMSAVYKHVTSAANSGATIGGASFPYIGVGGAANLTGLNSGTLVTAAANDNAWHANNSLAASASGSAINIDGTDTAGLNSGTTGIAAGKVAICRSSGNQMVGFIAEATIWASTSTSTNRGNIYTNQHGVSGYNGSV